MPVAYYTTEGWVLSTKPVSRTRLIDIFSIRITPMVTITLPSLDGVIAKRDSLLVDGVLYSVPISVEVSCDVSQLQQVCIEDIDDEIHPTEGVISAYEVRNHEGEVHQVLGLDSPIACMLRRDMIITLQGTVYRIPVKTESDAIRPTYKHSLEVGEIMGCAYSNNELFVYCTDGLYKYHEPTTPSPTGTNFTLTSFTRGLISSSNMIPVSKFTTTTTKSAASRV